MRFEDFSFGSLRIDGVTYENDVVIDRGEIRKRKKKASKQFGDTFARTPLIAEEDLPWKCRRLPAPRTKRNLEERHILTLRLAQRFG